MVKKTGLCVPVILYIVWTIICVCLILAFMFKANKKLGSKKHEHLLFVLVVNIVLMKIIVAILLCSAMDYLCCSGHSGWAWFIIVSIVVITALTIYSSTTLEKSIENMQDSDQDSDQGSDQDSNQDSNQEDNELGGNDLKNLVGADMHPSQENVGRPQGGIPQGGVSQGGVQRGVPQGIMSGGMQERGMHSGSGHPEAFNNFY